MEDSSQYNHLTDPLRAGRITASAVAGILGHSPWQTRDDVMRRMVRDALGAEREDDGDNPATAWGRANESGGIMEFEMESGYRVTPSKFIVCEHEPIFRCSPDGLIGDDGGHEQKCPFGLRKAEAPVPFKTLAEQEQYADQVQHSLYVTGRKWWTFAQWAPNGTVWEKVGVDQEWRDTNLPILRQFAAELADTIANPDLAAEHLAPRRVVIDTPTAARMVREYDDLSEAIDNATERRKEVLASLVALAGDKDALVAGRKLTLVTRQGSVSYAKAISELAPDADLSKWRGKETKFWQIK